MGELEALEVERANKSKHLYGCYKKGVAAKAAGMSRNPPYKDTRTWFGGVTWNRARINAWYDGYDGRKF